MASKFDLKQARNGEYYFNLKAANRQVILTSERYTSKQSALTGIRAVKRNAVQAKRFEVRTSRREETYFVLKASNGEPIGTSEMYEAARGVQKGIASVQRNAPTARIDDLA